MSNDNTFFEEFAKLAGSAMNNAMGSMTQAKEQFDVMVKQHMEGQLAKMDLVSREEFEVVREMAAKAREEQAKLEKKIAALEAKNKKK